RERAVSCGVRRGHCIRDPVAVPVPLVLGDVGHGDFLTRAEIADDQIRAGVLTLLASALRACCTLRTPGARGAAPASCTPRTLSAPAPAAASAAGAETLVVQIGRASCRETTNV